MKKIFVFGLVVGMTTSLFAQQFYTVKNPTSTPPEGKPRPTAVVEDEKKMVLKCLDSIKNYMNKNGSDATIQEINKGRNGAFGSMFPKGHFYLSMARKKGAKGWPIVAHGSNPALVGFDVPDVSVFMDNTGWKYLVDLFAKKDASKIGIVDGLLWADPEWANGKKCRMYAYNTFVPSGSDEYWFYMAIWLDE